MRKWVYLLLPLVLFTGYSFMWVRPLDIPEYSPRLAPSPYRMLNLVNQERAKVGVQPLKIDHSVQKSAWLKATDFAERDYYSHVVKGTDDILTPEMSALAYKNCTYVSENISADEYTSEDTVNGKDGWMKSPPHRSAILDSRYSLTGFGVSQDNDGDYYAVQHFCVAK